MATKPFNQQLHDACDPPARDAVAGWIDMKWGFQAKPHQDKYAVDLVINRRGKAIGYAEVEVRDWGAKFCPYPTIHIAKRKEKLFNNDLKTLMFVVTSDFTHAYWTKVENIQNSPTIEVPNKAVKADEYFYDVDISKWQLVD